MLYSGKVTFGIMFGLYTGLVQVNIVLRIGGVLGGVGIILY